jgi:hypothetical protein
MKEIRTTYTVNENGTIHSSWHDKLLVANYKNKRGYARVQMRDKTFDIHRLVAEKYIPNPEDKPQVNHIDGNKKNNDVSNLEWVTGSENIQHAFDTGLKVPSKGEANGSSKLLDHQVLEIYNSTGNQRITGEEYGVSATIVSNIRLGKSWKHITLANANIQIPNGRRLEYV